MVRLLQAFSSFTLHQESQPPESLPPVEWARNSNSRIRREKIKPRSHLTLYVQVCSYITRCMEFCLKIDAGWTLGSGKVVAAQQWSNEPVWILYIAQHFSKKRWLKIFRTSLPYATIFDSRILSQTDSSSVDTPQQCDHDLHLPCDIPFGSRWRTQTSSLQNLQAKVFGNASRRKCGLHFCRSTPARFATACPRGDIRLPV